METKFQTSFIPKKPLVSTHSVSSLGSGTSILMVISIILFLVSIAGAAFSVYQGISLTKKVEEHVAYFAKMEDKFPSADLEKYTKTSKKIELTKFLLKKHIATPQIFAIISQFTNENVRFTGFNFSNSTGKDADEIKISLSGVGKDYFAVASQSGTFGSTNAFAKPMVSDVVEMENGNIGFSFSASINPTDLLYQKPVVENKK